MVNYREILRLSSDPKNSQRSIELMLHSSHHTIRKVQDAAKAAGISWPLEDDVTNEMLKEALFPEEGAATALYTQPDYPYIHKELARPGVNLTLLWTEYCRRCENDGTTPYMYTQFCEKYRQWARITKATMRIQHKPGDAMQVDWAGNTLDIYDPITGDVSKAYLFVAVLPCSCYAYAEACDDMKLENWLLCHAHAYSYFGGVTRLLIPDNLKTGVTKNTRYETILNRSYQELAEHYDTAIVPARVEHPMTRLADRYSAARLENACERLLAFTSTPSIRTLSTILKNGQDKVATPKKPEVPKANTQHGITRGAAYFRKGGSSK